MHWHCRLLAESVLLSPKRNMHAPDNIHINNVLNFMTLEGPGEFKDEATPSSPKASKEMLGDGMIREFFKDLRDLRLRTKWQEE